MARLVRTIRERTPDPFLPLPRMLEMSPFFAGTLKYKGVTVRRYTPITPLEVYISSRLFLKNAYRTEIVLWGDLCPFALQEEERRLVMGEMAPLASKFFLW